MLPSFFTPAAAWLFFLIAPLVLFYFLKLKRPRVVIPSLVLWQQVINDNRVNSPFQRFKRNLLLLLQLLLLILLILAAMQPYSSAGAGAATRLPILIDCSASMGAKDDKNVSRLEEAKDMVRQMIDGLRPDQQLAIISFGRLAQRMVGFTNDKRLLFEALDKVALQDVPSDVEEGLRLAQAMLRAEPFESVMLISDGNFPNQSALQMPFDLDYRRVAPGAANVGITALVGRRATADSWDVFATVEAATPGAEPQGPAMVEMNPSASAAAPVVAAPTAALGMSMPVTVELRMGEQVLQTQHISVTPGRSERLVFTLSATGATSLEMRLKPDGRDSLAADNVAYLDLATPRALWVFCPPTLGAVRHALEAMEGLRLYPEKGQRVAASEGAAATEKFDLVATDRYDDLKLTANTQFVMGLIPDELGNVLVKSDVPIPAADAPAPAEGAAEADTAQKSETLTVVDWNRLAPALQHVELGDLLLVTDIRFAPGAGAGDLENQGFETIAHGSHGPLLIERHAGPRYGLWMLFHPERSTFPYRAGFPIMIQNVVNIARQNAGLLETPGHKTGVLPSFTVSPLAQCTIIHPDGTRRTETADDRKDGTGVLAGVAAPRVGRYQVKGGGLDVNIGASLLSTSETSLTGVQRIQFAEMTVQAAADPQKVDRSYWPVLAAIALGLLLLEWYFFQRKPGGFGKR